MIQLEHVYKKYMSDSPESKWVIDNITLCIPKHCNVGLIGENGAGKSTLLRLIGGMDHPTKGEVKRTCRVSWPLGLSGGLQGSLTGRQNAKFVCRLHGFSRDLTQKINFIRDFAEIGAAFDRPVKTYSTGMQARLKFALSLAFDFDIYLVDEITAVGDAVFKKKSQRAFAEVANDAGIIMVSHDEGSLREFCRSGIYLDKGKAIWFDSLDDALSAYKERRTHAKK